MSLITNPDHWEDRARRVRQLVRELATERFYAEQWIYKIKRRYEGVNDQPGTVSPNMPIYFVRAGNGSTIECTNNKATALDCARELPLGMRAKVYQRIGSEMRPI